MDQPLVQTADHDMLVRLETKVDIFISSQNDHEIRLRIMEKQAESRDGISKGMSTSWRWLLVGVGLLISVSNLLTPYLVSAHN